ncbi:MAG: hypothetical protein DRR19_00930 [Candidatus Parabeggiatoa sp. nov. 1]|nr:MAG: hypothetical protein DRR19_00930 [Gammaproteobacteria bacterium]
MVQMHKITRDSFLLMYSDWKVNQAEQFLERLKPLEPSHVIVQQIDTPSYYHLFKLEEEFEFKPLLSAHPEQTLQNVLKLDETTATPVLDAYENANKAPDLCIVTDKGHLIGFYDATMPLPQRQKHGDTTSPDEFITRSLVANFPKQVALAPNETVSLLVSLSAEEVKNPKLPVALPTGTTVDIVIETRRSFVIVGKAEDQLVISDEKNTPPLRFKLKATALGEGQIGVLAFRGEQYLGQIELISIVVEQTTDENPQAKYKQGLGHVSIEPREPDLLLLIFEQEHHGQHAVTFRLRAKDSSLGLDFNTYGPIPLRMAPLQFVREFFRDIEKIINDKTAEAKLERKGTLLFEQLFPKELQVLLWELKDRIQSVKIQSEESWIPWELCRLQGKDENGQIVESPFFCELFLVTRKILGTPRISNLTLNNLALVVPSDSGLKSAIEERDYLLSLKNDQRQVTLIGANFLDVIEALASGQYDAWHFTGHGLFREPDSDLTGIELENNDQLRAGDINGKVNNLGITHHPIIFFNACQAGRGGLSLTDIGGFAAQSLRAGAGAFIGAYWSIFDNAALKFAEAFYEQLLAGQPIGKAVQQARLEVKKSGDPTWLAYTVYAEPFAIIKRETEVQSEK